MANLTHKKMDNCLVLLMRGSDAQDLMCFPIEEVLLYLGIIFCNIQELTLIFPLNAILLYSKGSLEQLTVSLIKVAFGNARTNSSSFHTHV